MSLEDYGTKVMLLVPGCSSIEASSAMYVP